MKLNNGILRGTIYAVQAMGLVLLGAFSTWENEPPKNNWSFAIVTVATILAGVGAVRAYIDQHLARNPPKEDENKPVTIPVTVQVDKQQVETTTTSGTEVAKVS